MNLPDGLMVKISKAISVENGIGRMSIIVRKPFDSLEKELNKKSGVGKGLYFQRSPVDLYNYGAFVYVH